MQILLAILIIAMFVHICL